MKTETIALSDFEIDESFLAHTSKSCKKDETLIEHSYLTLNYFEKIVADKQLEKSIDTLIDKVDSENSSLVKEMFVNAIFLHDIGKINPSFQAKKMSNPLFKEYNSSSNSSNHSGISAEKFIAYYRQIIDQLPSRKAREKLNFILYSFSYHQAKHHGRLKKFQEYQKDDSKTKSYFTHLNKFNIEVFEFYILNKLLFSLLVSSDYYATTEYMATLKIDNFGLFGKEDIKKLKAKFDNYLNQLSRPMGINKLRNEIFKEAETNMLQNLNKNIFYLEAPTGSGKTITSINLALHLLDKRENVNKLFYIFPFNTLVEQTKNVFDDIFDDLLDIQIINSITPICEDNQEDKESNYEQSYINRLFFHAPAIITTHVALFNILFGTSKEDNFPLWQLANSVIILDEIQSYNNHLWWYMVEFFDKYASYLNIKIVIMSATLPKLDYFLKENSNFVDLIVKKKRNKLFTNSMFRDRVKVDFSLLEKKNIDFESLEKLLEEKKDNYQKILFEFIKKQSAREFYNLIKDKYSNVYELSGDDNKAYRQYVINQTKKNLPIIVVATQVIEAGVDIDMDLGFKDISTLDSEEQFMGRINRSCKKKGAKVYFFDMDDASKIYRDDNRIGFDLKQKKYQEILKNKNYADYYREVLKVIQRNGLKYKNGFNSNYDNFEEELRVLDYEGVAKTMTLINSQSFSLYFPFKIDITKFKDVQEFKSLDKKYLTDNYLDGLKVWNEFIHLHKIDTFQSYSEKEIKKSQLNALMQFFTFSLLKFYDSQRPFIGEEMYGYYFIESYDEFITDEYKFDRENFNELKNSNFL